MRRIVVALCLIFAGCKTTDYGADLASDADGSEGVITRETCALGTSDPFLEIYNGRDFAVVTSVGVEPATIFRLRADGSVSGQLSGSATALDVWMIGAFHRKVRVLRDALLEIETGDSPVRRWLARNVLDRGAGDRPEAELQASLSIAIDLDPSGHPSGTFTVTGGSEFESMVQTPVTLPSDEGMAVVRFPLKLQYEFAGTHKPGAEPDVKCTAPVEVAATAIPRVTLPVTENGKELQASLHMTAAATADLTLSLGYLADLESAVDENELENAARILCAPFGIYANRRYPDDGALRAAFAKFLKRHPGLEQWHGSLEIIGRNAGLAGDVVDRAVWNGCVASARSSLRRQ